MSLLVRARQFALTTTVAVAVTVPAFAAAAPASAAPTTAAAPAAAAAGKTSVVSADRKRKSSRAAAVRRSALSRGYGLRGVPYRYGGSTPSGFDCSGFTSYVYKKAGKSIPRTASAQRRATTRISRSSAVPGDLVFFHRGGRVYHVGIYAGSGKVLHAPRTGTRVRTEKIWTSNVSFGRVKA